MKGKGYLPLKSIPQGSDIGYVPRGLISKGILLDFKKFNMDHRTE